MTDYKHDPSGATRRFVEPDFAETAIELAYTGANLEKVLEIAAKLFRADNPDIPQAQESDALEREAGQIKALIVRLSKELGATHPLVTIVSAARITKAHIAIRLAGLITLILGVLLLIPIPLVIAAGVEESLLIERVIAEPPWGLAYGLAPIGAVLGVHGLHSALHSDRARHWFDLALYGLAIAAFVYWASLYGPTFLSDPLSGFGAAAGQATSLSAFYFAHILLEVTAASAAYTAAMQMLTAGARRHSVTSEAFALLKHKLWAAFRAGHTCARRRDALAAQPGHYANALAAYQARCEMKFAVAEKLLVTKSAADALSTLKEMRDVLHATPFTGDFDA